MNALTDIGEMLISDAKKDYFFRPSFSAMSAIGSPAEIVMTYSVLNGFEINQVALSAIESFGEIPGWLVNAIRKPAFGKKILSAAMHVMTCCCDDDITSLIGEWKIGKSGIVYKRGDMSPEEIIIIGRELIEHGIIGKAKVRKLQRNEGKGEYSNEFRAIDYINSARAHFNMTRNEAVNLTMTEFQLLLKNKFPDEKGLTREEYDSLADDYLKKKAERLANGK